MNKKIIWSTLTTITIIVFILLAAIIVFYGGKAYNDAVLNSFSQQLFNCNLPKKTTIIEKQKICGKLNGNGDGMDFLAVTLIKSENNIDELKKYYENVSFKGAKSSSKTAIVQIIKVSNNKLQTDYLVNRCIYFTEPIDESGKYYAIIIYDGGYWNFFDLRGT